MKKPKSEIRILYVLINNKVKETVCNGFKVVGVSFSLDELKKFKHQLNDEKFEIKEEEYDGWSSGIRYSGYFLKEIDNMLIPNRDISSSENERNKILFSLKNTKESLEELKEYCLNNEDKRSYDMVIYDVVKRFEDIANSKLDIKITVD